MTEQTYPAGPRQVRPKPFSHHICLRYIGVAAIFTKVRNTPKATLKAADERVRFGEGSHNRLNDRHGRRAAGTQLC
jgi:hypothetical protein